jgi:alginate O-acetyltransferase complex protein AlgI
MLFNSFQFLLFFPIVTILYFTLPSNIRWLLLLVASCVFYMAFVPYYILILFAVILVDYIAGIWLEKTEGGARKTLLVFSLIANVSILFVFKYYNFFNTNLQELSSFIGWNYGLDSLAIVLPIGLSFHTFQSMSYTLEVYWGKQKAERHLGIYALYVLFYPQLVAGPIERPQNLLHQFRENHAFDYKRVVSGFQLMASGFIKKVVVADNLALFVNQTYGNPEGYRGLSLWIATYFFAFQIFCDFSGYSDIARGTARVMGYELMVNFKRPYLAKSIEEFWRRWHISLSTWFRDYLYIPLGGNRVTPWRKHLNVFVVFLISGFWHGANWTFLVWGGLHGLFLLVTTLPSYRFPNTKFSNLLKVLITFHLACFAWIFFRAESINDALLIIRNMINFAPETFFGLKGLEKILLLKGMLLILCTMYFQHLEEKEPIWNRIAKKPATFRYLFYVSCLLTFFLFGEFTQQSFIYFQF